MSKHEGTGNSYEVAVENAGKKAYESDKKQEYWKVGEVIVKVGNPHIKEYRVIIAPSP
jgi:flavin-binding protein dodecin